MGLHVMDGEGRAVERIGHGAGERGTGHQGSDQPGPGRVGDGIQVARRAARFFQGVQGQLRQAAHMVARGQFRDNPAVLLVRFNLAVQPVSKEPARTVPHGDPGFVAGSLDAQHPGCLSHGRSRS